MRRLSGVWRRCRSLPRSGLLDGNRCAALRCNRGGFTHASVKLLLYLAASTATLYAVTRAVWHSDGELGIELALLIAAVCCSGGAVVGAIDRQRPHAVSADNGGSRRT